MLPNIFRGVQPALVLAAAAVGSATFKWYLESKKEARALQKITLRSIDVGNSGSIELQILSRNVQTIIYNLDSRFLMGVLALSIFEISVLCSSDLAWNMFCSGWGCKNEEGNTNCITARAVIYFSFRLFYLSFI